VLITWGEHGMWVLEGTRAAPGAEAVITGEAHLPAVAREVADVTGAGDTVVASAALALAAGASLAEAAVVANHAAGIAVAHFGPTPSAPPTSSPRSTRPPDSPASSPAPAPGLSAGSAAAR